MPKVKRKAPVKKRKSSKKKSRSIGLYALIGLVCAGLVYWLSTAVPNHNSTSGTEITEQDQNSAPEQHSKKKHKKRDKTQNKVAAANQQSTTAPQSGTAETVAKQAVTPPTLDDAIVAAIKKLGVPDTSYRRKERDKQVSYSIPLSRHTMDLTFANIIIKSEVERKKGRLLSGIEKENRQTLTFGQDNNPKKYIVELYYDSKVYADKEPDKVMAIVIDDFGNIGGSLLDKFMTVDKTVCFAIFPTEKNSIETMQRAHDMGRETLIHVPMEPLNYPAVNPGKDPILVTMSENEINNQMEKFIAKMYLCKGINNHMGSLATSDEGIMKAVMISLKKHNLYFLDSRTSNVSIAYNVAQKAHVSAYRNDIFLDSPNIKAETMDNKLQQCIDMASKRNQVVAIMHCHTAAHLAYLQQFIARAKAAGFKIVPLSTIGQYNIPSIF